MRVAIYFDGKNFYSGWRAVERPRVDFPGLARWIVERVDGDILWGAHYYTGIEAGEAGETHQQEALRAYLEMLDFQPGFFVHRFPRHQPTVTCHSCGAVTRPGQDKEIDTTLVADIVRFAALDAYDCLVLLSGDQDYVPAIEAVRAFGKQAYVATWGRGGLSKRLRLAAFDHIDLTEDVDAYCTPNGNGDSPCECEELRPLVELDEEQLGDPTVRGEVLQTLVQEIGRAESKFNTGYVGLNYFLTRWRFERLSLPAEMRRKLLDEAVALEYVEIYEACDGAKALRVNPQ